MNHDINEPDLLNNDAPQQKPYDFPRLYRPTLLSASRNSVILLIFMSLKFLSIRGVSSHLYFIGITFVLLFCVQDFFLKVMIDYNKIEVYYFGSHQTLTLTNIRGRRRIRSHFIKMIQLESRSEWDRTIQFPAILETDAAWDAWMAGIPDLDGVEKCEELRSVREDSGLGTSPEARKRFWIFLEKAPLVLLFLCIATIPLTIFDDKLASASMALIAVAPWVGIIFLSYTFTISGSRYMSSSSIERSMLTWSLPLLCGFLLIMFSFIEHFRHFRNNSQFFLHSYILFSFCLFGFFIMTKRYWSIFSRRSATTGSLALLLATPTFIIYYLGFAMSVTTIRQLYF